MKNRIGITTLVLITILIIGIAFNINTIGLINDITNWILKIGMWIIK